MIPDIQWDRGGFPCLRNAQCLPIFNYLGLMKLNVIDLLRHYLSTRSVFSSSIYSN